MAGKASLTTEKSGVGQSAAHPPSHNAEYAINVAQAIQFMQQRNAANRTKPNYQKLFSLSSNSSHTNAPLCTGMLIMRNKLDSSPSALRYWSAVLKVNEVKVV